MKKQFSILTILVLLSTSHVFAGFGRTGSTITQSGTDSDLSGLSTYATVTTLGGVTFYDIGTNQLNFTGTQTIDGRTERIVSSYSPGNYVYQITGTLIINDFEDKSGDRNYFRHEVLISTYSNSGCCGNFGLLVSGTLIMNGGRIRSNSSILINAGSRLEIINGGFVTDLHNNIVQMRLFCNDFDVDGFFIKNFKYVLGDNALPASTITGLELFGGSVGGSGVLPKGSPYVFNNFSTSGEGSSHQVDVNDANNIKLINAIEGSDISVRGVINDSRSFGLYHNYRRVQITAEDLLGSKIDGAIVYVRDTNNGERRNWAAGTYLGDSYSAINFTDDRVYVESTNALGETNEFDVLLSALARPTGSVTNARNVGLNTQDIRGKLNDNSDLFDFHMWSYEHRYVGAEFALGGAENLNRTQVFFTDPNISESNRATVNAYTTIDNLDQLYDRAKSWKVTTANIEYPTISTQPVTAVGTVLDLGNRNLIVNPSAGSVFAINTGTNTITIKSTAALVEGTKFSSIKTSGTVSTAGGATLEFGYENPIGTLNKYVALSDLLSTDTVLIRDNNLGTDIVSVTGITGDYKAHFIAPADASDIIVSVTRPNFSMFLENYPETDLSFVRRINLQLTQLVAESQIEILNLVMKVLQKEEAIFRALDLSNPALNITNSTGPVTGTPSVDNQLAILEILNKVFVKVIANRRKLE